MAKRASKKAAKQKPLFGRVAKKPRAASKKKGGKPPKQTPREKLRATIKEYRRQLAIGAACYGKADELFAEIRKKLKPGTRIPLPGASEPLWAVIVDLFQNDDKIFKPVAMKRFELQIQDASGRAVRMRDRRKKAARK